jgi:hypothetical protein
MQFPLYRNSPDIRVLTTFYYNRRNQQKKFFNQLRSIRIPPLGRKDKDFNVAAFKSILNK